MARYITDREGFANMFSHHKFNAVAAAAAAMAALSTATPASAYVYSLSTLNIDELTLSVGGTSPTTVGTYTLTLANTAALNSAPIATGASCNNGANPCAVGPPTLDAAPANALANTVGFDRVNNVFAPLGTHPTASYSGADNVITSAQLVTGVATDTQQIAEMLLNANGFANANSEIQSTTNLSWSFTVAEGATVSLRFLADPDQRVAIAGDTGLYSAQSNMEASFTLTNSSGDSVGWSPQGSAANNCTSEIAGVSCSETADGADLNRVLSTGVNPSDFTNPAYGFGLLAFGIDITGLAAGTYSIAFNALTSGNITRSVPEPGTTALLGLALTGLAFASRRRNTKR